ncbi:MAG: hypothetical protein ABR975_09950, partial [Vulcanimicrobiaceae bacterium]
MRRYPREAKRALVEQRQFDADHIADRVEVDCDRKGLVEPILTNGLPVRVPHVSRASRHLSVETDMDRALHGSGSFQTVMTSRSPDGNDFVAAKPQPQADAHGSPVDVTTATDDRAIPVSVL